MTRTPTLRPVTGTPAEVERLVAEWIQAPGGESAAEPAPLTVRTSGSSGEPKQVALTRAAVVASATATLSRIGGPGRWVLALPPHHVAGLQVIVRSVLSGSSPVVLADHGGLAAAAAALRSTPGAAPGSARRYCALVPTQLHRMLADPHDTAALASFDAVLVGGAAASPDLIRRAREQGARVVTTYGMTETCGGCVYDGAPLDQVRVRLGDDSRVEIAGPVLFAGYADDPALTASVLRDGWLRTSDLGRLDADGRLEILGRLDDMVVSGGVNVSLPAVERRLLSHPAIRQVAVVGVPDAEWGTRVLAVLVSEPGLPAPSRAEVRDFVSQAHPRAWAPLQVVTAEALPMLASGKVDRQALRRELSSSAGPRA